MAVKAGDLELDLIDSLTESVGERLEHEPAAAYREFVRQYYHWVPAKDLADRRPVDLAGAIVSHWRLARQREPGEVKVSVYNPDRAADGWQSPYTAIEVVSDDMPFLVDSVTMELARQGYGIELIVHPVMRVVRDSAGLLHEVLASGGAGVGWQTESVIHVEVARQAASERLAVLHSGIEVVLEEVRAAVEDWGAMRTRTTELAAELRRQAPPCGAHELAEAQSFLAWLANENFTFLGYREYRLGGGGDGQSPRELSAVEGTGLGILRGTAPGPPKHLKARALREALSPHPLVLTKANSRATVHRPAYLDYVGVKQFAPDGRVIGERRFLGLYTTDAYQASPREIPLLRDKFVYVMDKAGFPDDSHDAKGLVDILESLPRDLLVQIDADDLFEVAIGILGLGERQRVRLFVVPDRLDRFVSCTLCLPRDRFNTENRLQAGRILADAFGGDQVDWRLHLSESLIVRVDYVVHCPDGIKPGYEVTAVEARIARATRAWGDDLRAALITEHGEQRGLELYAGYATAFPPGYRADNDAAMAIADIARIERLQVTAVRFGGTQIHIYRRRGDSEQTVRGKLLSITPVLLSAVVPKFEHMGATVVDERPYEISPRSGGPVWVYDFGLRCDPEDLDRAGDAFAPAFLGAWSGELEDDRLNGLVMRAGLTGREVTIVRAVLRYLRQSAIAFSDAYMIQTLLDNPQIARLAVALFAARFDPDAHDPEAVERLADELRDAIDGVQSLDADRILRSFAAVLAAMLRTNYYRYDRVGDETVPTRPPAYLSFKLDPTRLEFLPRPRPRYEIFVYSPRVEGIHLRGGAVARGGLRWSDRREDFRTEVLGLMKAQMVKNALIVPVGSKGGFVVKRPPARGGREAQIAEGIACYRTFLSGLLDLTDNYAGDKVLAPERVVRYDGDDPYLVVAADKGTAAFSDIANEVAAGYGFWLGDAFASGGSHGYDHKRMGITARGAWESIKRHFRELGTDVARQDFTVVGIGDMSGDVFGNGMLLSPHIRLAAAFNHAHIFLDPNPDPAAGLAERRRLFALSRSGWDDYDRSLISPGGGVHSRASKAILISDEVTAALGIEADSLTPNELISAILRAPVDLLFNGGIGTYVKASSESQRDAGDRANDGVRVDGAQLRCRVVAEGGNLGLTQRGRIEYALAGGADAGGGRINTDAIDNVAGVNCSDHEVNIKILLGQLTATGEMSDRERNDLLRQMTDGVAEQVLYGSYTQTQAMSLALSQATAMVEVHARLIRHLEQVASLDREIEYLPSEEALAARRGERRGLSAPELATIMAYCKIYLYVQLLDSDLPEDPSLVADLQRYFPEPLPERYTDQMRDHRLRRELVATIVANQLVDRAGMTFAFRLGEETGASAPALARAYAVAREVFSMRDFWAEVEALDNQIEAGTQLSMLIEGRRLVERAARWLVRSRGRSEIDVTGTTARFAPGARVLAQALPGVLLGADRESFQNRLVELAAAGVPPGLARHVASMPALLSAFDIVEDGELTDAPQPVVMAVYFGIGSRLGMDWLRDRILELPRNDRWQALARAALRDDLYEMHRALTRDVLARGTSLGAPAAIDGWLAANRAAVERSQSVVADVKSARTYDTTTLPVALRELKNLVPEPG
ncbi:MAG TPA: NAD-glutamate dehydrogenase [Solirubrobacteraceae bacterium]|nr:NAD-glutamate dehydrogenase [Solirubrobacteraceae bacterium]